MIETRRSITSVCLALLIAGCGSGGNSSGGTGGDSSGGATGNQTGGTIGNPTGGNTGADTGGKTGSPTGGTTGADTGGATGNPKGGTTGNPTGGTTGNPKGGTTGNPTGGATGNPKGGTTGNPAGGTTGDPTGGTTGGKGGTTGGGSGGATAGQGGATTGSGGATGAAGATTASNVLVTSASGAYWKTAALTESTGSVTVTIDDSKASQTWEGFGGAFNEMGWNYLTSQTMKDQAIQAMFGKDGCNFAWGRIPIGASDYAMSRYTDDEVPSGSDTSMSSFSIARDKEKLIPYIKAALAVKPEIRFWASPWTPPTWMKTGDFVAKSGSNKKTSSNFDSGDMKSDEATLKAFAQYLVKWVQAFKEEGIKVEIVSPQNEPNYLQNYPSCHWDTSVFVSFVGKYFGPAITAAGLDLKIMDGTLSNPTGDSDIGQQVLKDATAKSYIGAIGVQWGMSDASQVKTLAGLAGGIPIWLSETKCDGTQNSSGPAPNDFGYATASWGYIKGAIGNGISAYNAWNMVLDKNGLGIDDARKWAQNTLIVADSGSLIMTPAYYVYRHFSQFVDPGAKVVGATGGDAVGFKNPDGSIVAVLHSTSANANYVVSIGGKKFGFSMPNGWATIKYKP